MPHVRPVLSICVPTFNRAHHLGLMLENLSMEVEGLDDKVEIVISDNASQDDTENMCRTSALPLRYGRLPRTVGVAKNIRNAIEVLAQGRYIWLVGDDDVIVQGSVRRIVHWLENNPELPLTYLNFGWIPAQSRAQCIRVHRCVPQINSFTRWQCDAMDNRGLARFEDLFLLPGNNPSVMFSGFFAFVVAREAFVEAWRKLRPSDSLDGSSRRLDDCFPHARLLFSHFRHCPVGYIGSPCLLQGINGWEWKRYAVKNMLHGTWMLLNLAHRLGYRGKPIARMWESFAAMAGKLYFHMHYKPEDHRDEPLVRSTAIRKASAYPEFWASFLEESRIFNVNDYEVEMLDALVDQTLSQRLDIRIGLWGIMGRGSRLLERGQAWRDQVVWVGDRDPVAIGTHPEESPVPVSPVGSFPDADLDLLILALAPRHIEMVMEQIRCETRNAMTVVTLRGCFQVGGVRSEDAIPE